VEAGKLLNRIGCGHLASRAWALLSQGERQKVLIGRALMARPKLLLLDEPCAGLDPPAREEFLHLIDKMGKTRNGPTLVLVTHHVEEIMPVFSHVLLMRDGSVLACGSKSKVMTTGLIGETFESEVSLKKNRSRYRLDL
jgi:iron complex transport system ATP-binding protein